MTTTSSIRITELRRMGSGVMIDTPLVFEWDSASHSMPQDALEYELQINTVRESDPGTEEPIEQIMGVEWTPFEMHGEWMDKWAGPGFASDTEREFCLMAGRVPLVRVQIKTRSFVGIITSVKIRYRLETEIGYTIKFSPHSNENIGSFRRTPGTGTVASPVDSRLGEIDSINGDLKGSLDTARANVQSATADIEDSADQLDAIDTEYAKAVAANNAIANDAIDSDAQLTTVDITQARLLALAASFSRIAAVATASAVNVSVLAANDVLAYDDVIQALNFEEWSRNTYCDSILMAAAARSAAIDARSRAALRPLTVHRCKNGESLQRISNRYYGTPNAWRLIYDANNMSSILLDSGTEIIIPERQR